ncbi:hemagglutinin repeat-containing protein, partial [Helicobacter sp. 13S00482-2]|uniref:two-partner secretion domain-containing protein n=1 Tax=Helicobacter sp. 13S00482-2 TaxID=1476200 RepID=UPI00117A02CC
MIGDRYYLFLKNTSNGKGDCGHKNTFLKDLKSINFFDSLKSSSHRHHLKMKPNPFKQFLCSLLCLCLTFYPVFAQPLSAPMPSEVSLSDTEVLSPIPSDISNHLAPSSSLQIIPDVSNPSYAPSMDKAPNGIEIINITPPNDSGISNNHYRDFNIKEIGAIINNSNHPITPTELAGLISSNPNLGDKEASLILNQVTSTHSTSLLGPLEIAGKAAGLLIANPNGISCEGCSFFNATSVSLSTALIPPSELSVLNELSKQSLNPDLSSRNNLAQELISNIHLRVIKGHINIDSLDSSNIPSLNILSKSLSISHNLYAKNLNIILGSNDITLDQKGALLLWQPLQSEESNKDQAFKLALDVAYIGGVYANSIYLIASDEDASINNSGILATFASSKEGDGGFVIDTKGHLIVSNTPPLDTPSSEDSSGDMNHIAEGNDANDVSNTNSTDPSILRTSRGIYAFKSLNIKAKSLQNDSLIESQEDLSLKLQENLNNQGSIISWGTLDLFSTSLINTQAFIYANTLQATIEYLNNMDSSFILGKNILIHSKDLNNIHSMIYSTEDLSIDANNVSNIAQVSLEKKLISQEHISQGEWNKKPSPRDWFLYFNPFMYLKDGDKDFTRSIYQEIFDSSDYAPSILMSAHNLSIEADVLNNQNGSIIAPVTNISANTFHNDLIEAREIIQDKGKEARNYQDVWYEKECRGWDWATICIKRTSVRHEKTRLKVFDDYFKESSSPIALSLPSLKEDLSSYFKNPYVFFLSTSLSDHDKQDASNDHPISALNVSNSIEILDPSHSLEFLSFNPYHSLLSKDAFKSPAFTLKDNIYTDPQTFISSDYFYDHFKNTSDISSFLSHLKNSYRDSSYLSDFYNSKSFLNQSLHLEKLNEMLASYEANHLAHKLEVFKDTTKETSPLSFYDINNKGMIAFKANITTASFYNDSYIYADDAKIESKDTLINKGSIHSKDLFLSSEGKLYHSGEIISNNTALNAQDIEISSEIKSSDFYSQTSNSPKHTQENLSKVALITTNNLSIKSSGDVLISAADLKAKDKMSIEGEMVFINTKELKDSYQDSFKVFNHLTEQKTHLFGSSISIKAKESLDIQSAELSAFNHLSLYSDGDIHLLASNEQDDLKKDFYAEEKGFLSLSKDHHSNKEFSISQKQNVFKASNISIQAKGSIISNGGDYEAEDKLTISAHKDYIQTSLHHRYGYSDASSSTKEILGIDVSGDDFNNDEQRGVHTHSHLKAKDIFIQTGGDTTLMGVELASEEKTSILAGGSFSLLNPKDTYSKTSGFSDYTFMGLFSNKGDKDHQEISQTSSSISAGSLDIKAYKDIHIIHSHINTSGDAIFLSQHGNINVINDYGSTSDESSFASKDFNSLTFSFKEKLSFGADFKYSDVRSKDSEEKVLGSVFDVGGNLVLKTGDEQGDINIIASNLSANKNVLLDSKNVHIHSALNSSSSKEENLEGDLNISFDIGNAYADIYFASDKFYKSLENFNELKKQYQSQKELYEHGKISKNALDEFKYNLGFASLNIANASLGVVSSLTAAASAASTSLGTGFYGSISTSISGTQNNIDEQNTSVVASTLKAGENIFIRSQDSISQIGSHLQANGAIFYEAKNNIDILSSSSTHQLTKEKKNIGTTTSYGSNGFGMSAEIGASRHREISSSSYSSSLKAERISLSTQKDIHINGGVLSSKKADIRADNLSIISSSSSSYSHMNAHSVQAGYGSSSVNGGFSKDKGDTDREWIEQQSGIFSTEELNVNIAHHTYLEAAYLFSATNELSLSTDTFSYKDIHDKDYLSAKGISVNVQSDNKSISHSSTQIGLSHQGKTTEGKTLATLGKGQIHITHPDDLIKTINTDLSTSTSILQDQITGTLNVNAQIDNRFFSSKGLKSIYADITSVPSNLIKTTNGAFTLAFNPFITATEVLLNPDISLKESINQWKANQSTAVAINNLDRKTINQLSSGQDITDIQSAIKGENQGKVHIYYDEQDKVNGFYDNKNKQIYLNAFNDTATNTKTFIKTYTHENAHQFTHNDHIANNAGTYGNFSYHLSNFLGFSSINTKGRATHHNDNTTTYAPISSKQ